MATTTMLTLPVLQADVAQWRLRNFGSGPGWHALLGLVEEVGELAHAYLKRAQGIRGTPEEHDAAIRDAVADITIYLADFCGREGIDLQSALDEVWSRVRERDWKNNARTGGVE